MAECNYQSHSFWSIQEVVRSFERSSVENGQSVINHGAKDGTVPSNAYL